MQDETSDKKYTDDTLFAGAVHCRQHIDGYRFSVDAVLAAHFIHPEKNARVLDLGCGCGIIGLILMYRWASKIAVVEGLELQSRLCALARQNFQLNGYQQKCTCRQGDVKDIANIFTPESFTHVICNPPYYLEGKGRQNISEETRVARHQIAGGLNDFTRAASLVVKNRGSVCFVYPAEQIGNLIFSLAEARLEVKRMQFVYSYPGLSQTARLVLVHCLKNGGSGMSVLPPLYIYAEKNGKYSAEMQRLYAASWSQVPVHEQRKNHS